jgi:hypothetical protein
MDMNQNQLKKAEIINCKKSVALGLSNVAFFHQIIKIYSQAQQLLQVHP